MSRKFSLLAIVFFFIFVSATSTLAGSWRFPLGLTYVSGFKDIMDRYENNFKAEGNTTWSTSGLPVGLQFQPYYQFDFGLGIGVSIGPVMMIFGDREFFDFPVGVDARYIILPGMDISPYIRAGIKYHFASGDYVKSSSVGAFGGVGLEFFRTKRVGMGLEFLMDSSSIEFDKKTRSGGRIVTDKEKINPMQYSVNISVIF
jgi:hypothetical protein